MEGGFAYLEGRNSEITITKMAKIGKHQAYVGGAIYAKEHSLVTIDNSYVNQNEAYDGIIYIQGGSLLNITNG